MPTREALRLCRAAAIGSRIENALPFLLVEVQGERLFKVYLVGQSEGRERLQRVVDAGCEMRVNLFKARGSTRPVADASPRIEPDKIRVMGGTATCFVARSDLALVN